MAVLLFIIAVLCSAGPIYLAYLSLSEQLALPVFTLASTTIAVVFIFLAFHFMNRTLPVKKQLKQEQKQFAKQKQELETQLANCQKELESALPAAESAPDSPMHS